MQDQNMMSPVHNDCYETKINGDIRQLSIGQLLHTNVEDGSGDVNSGAAVPMKADICGQYNNKIKVNIPKQEQPPTIVFNLSTKNHGTVLQLDPEATKEFLTNGSRELNTSDRDPIFQPVQSLSSRVLSNIISQDENKGKYANLVDKSAIKSSTWKMIKPSTGNNAVSSIPSISFDVEDDGNGNKVIGIAFPNTNLSQENGAKAKWRKWLIPLKIGALVVLIVLIIIIYEHHKIENKKS